MKISKIDIIAQYPVTVILNLEAQYVFTYQIMSPCKNE